MAEDTKSKFITDPFDRGYSHALAGKEPSEKGIEYREGHDLGKRHSKSPYNVKSLKESKMTKVIHEEHGIGEVLQESDTYQDCYDVMFEHGIEIDVPVDELQEVSKALLGRYIKKAANDSALANFNIGRGGGDPLQAKKRRIGIETATDKIVKEDELNELSIGYRNRYLKKAGRSLGKLNSKYHSLTGDYDSRQKAGEKGGQREMSMATARVDNDRAKKKLQSYQPTDLGESYEHERSDEYQKNKHRLVKEDELNELSIEYRNKYIKKAKKSAGKLQGDWGNPFNSDEKRYKSGVKGNQRAWSIARAQVDNDRAKAKLQKYHPTNLGESYDIANARTGEVEEKHSGHYDKKDAQDYMDDHPELKKTHMIVKSKEPKGKTFYSESIIDQLNGIKHLDGAGPVKFADGHSTTVPIPHALKALNQYEAIRDPGKKQAFTEKLSASLGSFKNTIGEDLNESLDEKKSYEHERSDEYQARLSQKRKERELRDRSKFKQRNRDYSLTAESEELLKGGNAIAEALAKVQPRDLQAEWEIAQVLGETREGQTVKIISGMKEFHGKIGTIGAKEGKAYRVHLHEPVHIPGVGHVKDDLWEPQHLKRIKD